jgi:hypothetical protein
MPVFLKEWLRYLFKSDHFTGALDVPGAPVPATAYLHEERLIARATNAFGNAKIANSPYPYEDQKQVGSCVPHGVGLALAIARKYLTGTYVRLSWAFVYRLRGNFPQAGAWLSDIFLLYQKRGAPLYTTLPDPDDETTANALVLSGQMSLEAEIFEGLEWYTMQSSFNDIGELAAVAQEGKGVAIIIFATYEEWAQVYPKIIEPNLNASTAGIRHCICILPDSGFIEGGVRYVAIQDSALFGNIPLRYLSEDFIKRRVYGAGYWNKVNIIGSGAKPHYTFTKVLALGARSPEVKAVQQLLISEGLLPSDCATGLFAGRTLAAVHAFQNKYATEILLPLGLNAPTDTWGSMCIAKANKLCQH